MRFHIYQFTMSFSVIYSFIYSFFLVEIFFIFVRWSDGMRCCRSDWPEFLLLSTFVCCQPTELILAYFFFNFTPPPPVQDIRCAYGSFGPYNAGPIRQPNCNPPSLPILCRVLASNAGVS